jgi:hypothetical protein
MDLNAMLDEFSYFMKNRKIDRPDGMGIFNPEIKKVPQNEYMRGGILDGIKEFEQMFFSLLASLQVDAQVYI